MQTMQTVAEMSDAELDAALAAYTPADGQYCYEIDAARRHRHSVLLREWLRRWRFAKKEAYSHAYVDR